jgi:hypothetical protein
MAAKGLPVWVLPSLTEDSRSARIYHSAQFCLAALRVSRCAFPQLFWNWTFWAEYIEIAFCVDAAEFLAAGKCLNIADPTPDLVILSSHQNFRRWQNKKFVSMFSETAVII